VFANPLSSTAIGVEAEIALLFISIEAVGGGEDNSFLQELKPTRAAMRRKLSLRVLIFLFFMVWILDL
jgi:hypothetical protein